MTEKKKELISKVSLFLLQVHMYFKLLCLELTRKHNLVPLAGTVAVQPPSVRLSSEPCVPTGPSKWVTWRNGFLELPLHDYSGGRVPRHRNCFHSSTGFATYLTKVCLHYIQTWPPSEEEKQSRGCTNTRVHTRLTFNHCRRSVITY